MALDIAFYLVTRDIAIRSGVMESRYRTLDGRYVLDNKDLSRVRFTTDEYINGLKGIEKISLNEAETEIARGGFKTGDNGLNAQQDAEYVVQPQTIVESVENTDETQDNIDE